MRVAFVGIEKDWAKLKQDNYTDKFVKYHLELPFYYCKFGNNSVDVYSNIDEIHEVDNELRCSSAPLQVKPNSSWTGGKQYDVVIHWRKWFENFYSENAVNVINSQDHSYSQEWLSKVDNATSEGKLYGILCFPTWHVNNLENELSQLRHVPKMLPGVTLGVDTEIYKPKEKNPYDMLWASDPGRGLKGAIQLALKLFQKDNRFKLHVCWPDYYHSGDFNLSHPAIQVHKNLSNGPELWDLFNKSSFLPYTSTFMEPSSRAHRQAMAAGCIVLYPKDMGTPSYLIHSGVDGIVGGVVDDWANVILKYANDDGWMYSLMSSNARQYAVSENWEVQAKRFNKLFKEIRNDD